MFCCFFVVDNNSCFNKTYWSAGFAQKRMQGKVTFCSSCCRLFVEGLDYFSATVRREYPLTKPFTKNETISIFNHSLYAGLFLWQKEHFEAHSQHLFNCGKSLQSVNNKRFHLGQSRFLVEFFPDYDRSELLLLPLQWLLLSQKKIFSEVALSNKMQWPINSDMILEWLLRFLQKIRITPRNLGKLAMAWFLSVVTKIHSELDFGHRFRKTTKEICMKLTRKCFSELSFMWQ